MKILYNEGDKPTTFEIKEGELVYNIVDGITYSRRKEGDIFEVNTPHIVSSSTGGVFWSKFADGLAILYGSTSITPVADTPSEALVTLPFPLTAITEYTAIASAATSRPDIVKQVTTLNISTTTFKIFILRSSTTNTTVRWQVTGRWK